MTVTGSDEQQLCVRAEMLADLDDLTAAVATVLDGAQGAGVDPRAVAGLKSALVTLDPGADITYDAGGRHDRRRGTGYASDGEFLEAVAEAEDQIQVRLREVSDLRKRVTAALDQAGGDLDQGRRDLTAAREALAAAYAMATRDPCNGCHSAREAAIMAAQAAVDDAETRIADAQQRIALCETAAEILGPLAAALTAALERIRRVAPDLGEVYELVYTFVRGGGKLPDYARWIEGGSDGLEMRLRRSGRGFASGRREGGEDVKPGGSKLRMLTHKP